MEASEAGGRSQQRPRPWGRLVRLGAEHAEPHVFLLKREWTIGRKKGEGGRALAALGSRPENPCFFPFFFFFLFGRPGGSQSNSFVLSFSFAFLFFLLRGQGRRSWPSAGRLAVPDALGAEEGFIFQAAPVSVMKWEWMWGAGRWSRSPHDKLGSAKAANTFNALLCKCFCV